jgi:tetratricopeptide (TPR) repeat protein
MGKTKKKATAVLADQVTAQHKQQLIFKWVLVALTVVLYYNTIFNYFSLDDNYINTSNEQNVQGLKALPEIFTTLYSDDGTQAYGYRALTRATFALEYQFTADSAYNPYVSHAINLILYALLALLLFKVLNRLFRGYNPWFAFLVAVIFIAHPTHTEVVASIKNRDVLLHFLFSFLAIWQFIRWADVNKTGHLILGLFYYLLALLSKETAIVQLAIFPLVLYFFTDIKKSKLILFVGVSVGLMLLFFGARMMFLPSTNRVYALMENPLVFEDSFVRRIATGFYGLGFYLKLLVFPFPLLYYYGYNMIPVVGFGNVWVILSAIAYVGMFVVALMKIKEKKLISFVILFYLIHMSMYANFVKPVPGIVGDRFVFFSSLSFAMALVWLLFVIFKVGLSQKVVAASKLVGIVGIVVLITLPYGYYVHYRNKQWKTSYTLFKADMERLDNSVKANNLYATEVVSQVNAELAKPVNPYKFVVNLLNKAEKHYAKAIELDSSHVASINSMGVINSRIHGNQALIRYRAYLKQDRIEDAENALKESVRYFDKARQYFREALKYDSANGSSFYNIGYTYELQQQWDSVVFYYHKEIEADGPAAVSLSRLSNAEYKAGNIAGAVHENEQIKTLFPESHLPYINLGNYAFMAQDTINMLINFEQAVKLGGGSAVSNFLASYFNSVGDREKAAYYQKLAAAEGKKTK